MDVYYFTYYSNGGRVIPFFIERGTGLLNKTRTYPTIEITSFTTLLAWMIFSLIWPSSIGMAFLASVAGIFQLLRWWGWDVHALWKNPMLWIIFLGYGWIPVGLFLSAYANFAGLGSSFYVHAFTAGAIGMLTIGIMSRVSLDHTGFEIHASKSIIASFIFVSLGALIRVIVILIQTIISAHTYSVVITTAGMLWMFGFVLFVFTFLPILVKSRIDGRSG